MIANLSAVGRQMVTIVDPHIRKDDEYYVYKQALAAGHMVLDKNGAVYEGWCWPGMVVLDIRHYHFRLLCIKNCMHFTRCCALKWQKLNLIYYKHRIYVPAHLNLSAASFECIS